MSNRQRGTDILGQLLAGGASLLAYLADLVARGNRRRVVVHRPDGRRLGEVSVTIALVVSGLLVLLVPTLVAIAALGALVAGVRVEIVRDGFLE